MLTQNNLTTEIQSATARGDFCNNYINKKKFKKLQLQHLYGFPLW